MGRARDPNRNKAFEIYKEHDGKIDLAEIASQLNTSPGTVRGWKSKDSWDKKLNGTFQKSMERSKNKKVEERCTKKVKSGRKVHQKNKRWKDGAIKKSKRWKKSAPSLFT